MRYPQLSVFTNRVIWVLALLNIPYVSVCAKAPDPLPCSDGKWRCTTSPHFELYSRESDWDARELLHNLEIVRAVFIQRLGLKETCHVDLTIYDFWSHRAFLAYAQAYFEDQEHLGGFQSFQRDRATIAFAPPSDRAGAQQAVIHEYIHYLFRVAECDPPLWFNEGTAQLLSSMRFDRDHVYIGAPLRTQRWYLQRHGLVPLPELLTAGRSSPVFYNKEYTGIFYAESWALLHFIEFGKSRYSDESVSKFLNIVLLPERVDRTDLAACFQSCFGTDFKHMERQLEDYISEGSFQTLEMPTPPSPSKDGFVSRPVTPGEARLRMAELSARCRKSEFGAGILLDAAQDPNADPRVDEALGAYWLSKGDEAAAQHWWEQALAKGSKNPSLYRALAITEGERVLAGATETSVLPDDVTARLRERLGRDIDSQSGPAASIEMLARVEAYSRVPDTKNVKLVFQKCSGLRDRRKTLLAMGRISIRIGRFDLAKDIIAKLDHHALEPADKGALQHLHEEYSALQADPRALVTRNRDQH